MKIKLKIEVGPVIIKVFQPWSRLQNNAYMHISESLRHTVVTYYWTLTPRRLRPIRVANKTQTRDPLNFGPCKADWPAAFVIK